MKPSADLTDVLAKLRERYAASAANTVSAFTQLAEQLQRNPVAPEVVDALRRELHRVHGTAGSYGFHDASRLAAALELVALRWEADPALDRSRRGAIVRQFSVALSAALDEHHPALLLLDVQMPEVDGITATRLLRAERRHAEIPILLVSSAMDAETRAAAFAAGADDLQTKPVVAVELTRRIARLLEIRRHRLVSRGVHPATSLWLPERTLRAFDEALAVATAEGRPMSLALLRPQLPPDGLQRSARWHRECALVAGALSVDGARAGFVDETALAVLFPMGAADAADRLEPFAEAASNETIAWCVGIAEQRRGSDVGARDLLHAAEEGWLSARDAGVRVHRWDEADAGIAPDVIVVEDDQALSDLICHALTARGLSYQVHRNGPEALAGLLALRVHERHPVVLMDVDLPGLDGFSLFERLRVERPGKFQVVFISVHASEGDQLRALRAGALDYLAKPVSLRVLMAKIAVWRAQERPV
jgi:DNA-binding response OmpR family regulator